MKALYVKKGEHERRDAKDAIRYIEYRPNRDHERTGRNLFGKDGFEGRWNAFEMVDEAPKGRYFYHIIINPDPNTEDTHKDLPLRELIDATMRALQSRRDTPVSWVAAIHDDHTDKRHIHALAVVKGRLNKDELKLLTDAATEEAHLQREAQDLMRDVEAYQRDREEAEWALEPEFEEDEW